MFFKRLGGKKENMANKDLQKKIESIDKKLQKLSLLEGGITWKNKDTCLLLYRKTITYPDNTTERLNVTGHDLDEVFEKMKIKEEEKNEQWKISQSPITLNTHKINDVIFKDAIEHWFYNFNYLNKRGRTFDREEQTLKHQILKDKNLANIQMQAITDVYIQNFLNNLMKTYSYSTVKKTYELLDKFFKHYYSKNMNGNPMNSVVKPKERDVKKISSFVSKDIRFFTEEEIEYFTHEALLTWRTGKPKYKFGPGLLFIMYTGLRVGEALALRWQDIDFGSRYLTVRIAASYEKERDENKQTTGKLKHIEDDPKTKAGKRKVYLIRQALDALEILKERQKPQSEMEYVFATSNGAPAVSYYNLRRAFNLICKNAELQGLDDGIGLHPLRHTFISLLCRKGIDKLVIARVVGQSDTKMIERIYYHITQEEKDQAIKMIDNDTTVVVGNPITIKTPEQLCDLDISNI